MKPKTTRLHNEQIRVLRAGTGVIITRTVQAADVFGGTRTVPVHTPGRLVDVRPHGRGVQYLVDIGDPRRVWIGGRYIKRPLKRRASRRKQAA